ncbi:hypothetical protein GGD63_005826 [Bradyrhizobium sp. cir1]|nr:hypothetical protein [Bradyrhizobium sp. cir1]
MPGVSKKLHGGRRGPLRLLAADIAADLRKSTLAEAIRYAVSRRAIFERFTPKAASSSTPHRRTPHQLQQFKNALRGQRRRPQTLSAIATLPHNGNDNVHPFAYIQILQRIANGLPWNEIDALMPWDHVV